MNRPFHVDLEPYQAAMISEVEPGTFVIETMRFLFPYQAKREAQAQSPRRCRHRFNEKRP